jgi:long-chain acyl-CoA synthetase
MGGGASINYCTPVTQKPEGESAIYRNTDYKDKLYDRPAPNLGTMKEILLNSFKVFPKNPALGI